MDLKISNYIKNTKIKYYAKEEKKSYEIKLDCSDGENPYGCSTKILEEIENIKIDDISKYSYDLELKNEIANYWNIGINNIVLTCGSVEGLYDIGILFRNENPKLLTYVPTFPNFINYCKMLGYKIEKVLLSKKDNYKYCSKELINKIDSSINLIYIDNPNNPTGQTMRKDDLIEIIEYAEKRNVGVLIDEAYGDYISKRESCIDLITKHENLIVIRTFSKGLGLAGIRGGYIISNKKICGYLEKMSHPYNISQISRKIAIRGLKETDYLEQCKKKIENSKKKILEKLPNTIKMAETNNTTSICMLYTDKKIDLCEKLKKYGIKVYSGESFENLDKRSIRLNIPNDKDIEYLIKTIEKL